MTTQDSSNQADAVQVQADAVQVVDTTPDTSEEREMTDERNLTPGDQLRALPTEAQQRGTRFVSAQAMQARLFSVYDAAAAAEDALALVQQQLTLTLNRSYYEADEIEHMASELDSLLALESLGLTDEDFGAEGELVSEE
jgi:hypothetical protein